MTGSKRFTGRQITTMVAMLCAAIVLAPVSAVAASSVFTISDSKHSSYKARVSSKGGLAVTAQDGVTGARARVDRGGHAIVGDGSGALTVDGTVGVKNGSAALTVRGAVTAYPPSATWRFTNTYDATYYDLTRPRTDAVNLTSLFVSGDSSTTLIYVAIYAATVPASATSGCSSSPGTSEAIWQGEAGYTHPISITFPTPLRSQPASGKKICLYAYVNHVGSAIMNASGYYGG